MWQGNDGMAFHGASNLHHEHGPKTLRPRSGEASVGAVCDITLGYGAGRDRRSSGMVGQSGADMVHFPAVGASGGSQGVRLGFRSVRGTKAPVSRVSHLKYETGTTVPLEMFQACSLPSEILRLAVVKRILAGLPVPGRFWGAAREPPRAEAPRLDTNVTAMNRLQV